MPGVAIEEIKLEFSALQATDISGALRERESWSQLGGNKQDTRFSWNFSFCQAL